MTAKSVAQPTVTFETDSSLEITMPRTKLEIFAMHQSEALAVLNRIVECNVTGCSLNIESADIAAVAWLAKHTAEINKGIFSVMLEEMSERVDAERAA